MKKVLYLFVFLFSTSLFAQELSLWDFPTDSPAATSSDPMVTASNATFGPALSAASYPAGNPSAASPTLSMSTNNWPSSPTVDVNAYIEFQINPDPTVILDEMSVAIQFDERRSGTGPSIWEARSSLDGFSNTLDGGAIPDNTSWRTQSVSVAGYTRSMAEQGVPFTIRIYGYGAEGSAGTWRFDNVSLTGLLINLPITLTSFTADRSLSNTVKLAWTTTTEKDNAFFEVEHSTDGIHYNMVEKIAGAGTTTNPQSYQYEHNRPKAGNNYYRLKQVDYNGDLSYSDTRVVFFESQGKAFLAPTVAIDQFTLFLEEAESTPIQIDIFDITGRKMMETEVAPNQYQLPLDISQFETGSYLLRIQADGTFRTLRFFKM